MGRIAEWTIARLPGNPWGNRLKSWALKAAGADVAWPCHIDSDVWVRTPKNLSAGPGLVLSRGAILTCSAPVSLGANCLVGYYAYIGTANHRVPERLDEDIRSSGHDVAPVVMGDGCWVGAHACVLPGVTLGRGVVVGAGSVVTKDQGDGVVCVGAPARVLRVRA